MWGYTHRGGVNTMRYYRLQGPSFRVQIGQGDYVGQFVAEFGDTRNRWIVEIHVAGEDPRSCFSRLCFLSNQLEQCLNTAYASYTLGAKRIEELMDGWTQDNKPGEYHRILQLKGDNMPASAELPLIVAIAEADDAKV